MKKIIFFLPCLFGQNIFAQNVAINSSGNAPDVSAMLDVVSASKGLLMPRVALTSSADALTVPAPATSLIVYNTGTGGLSPAGYYYNSGTTGSPVWVQLLNGGSPGTAWLLKGNTGTVAGTNFLGTTDANDLVVKTTGVERMRILSTGNVGIGTTAPSQLLHVFSSTAGAAILLNSTFGDAAAFISSNSSPATANLRLQVLGVDKWILSNDASDGDKFKLATTKNGNMFTVLPSGNVGIGTITPGAKLEVGGQVKITGGTPGLNKVLTSDAVGLASWVNPATLVAGSEWTDGGAFLYPNETSSGEKVSIGSTSGTTLLGTDSKLLVYAETGYGLDRPVTTIYSDESSSFGNTLLLDLHFANAATVGVGDKWIRFLKTNVGEVGNVNQEAVFNAFTGGHIGQSDENNSEWIPGMIVSADGDPACRSMGNSFVKIRLSKGVMDKAAIGVYTGSEFPHQIAYLDRSKPAHYYNALGEGMILVTDAGGDIEIGDYITSGNQPGYGMKQNDDLLHNYTVAKATESVHWSNTGAKSGNGFKWKLIACTYHGG